MKDLWSIYLPGPDEYHPAPNKEGAKHMAKRHNAAMDEWHQKNHMNLPPLPEPDSYLFQHDETGQTMFVESQQVEWGFEKNNPRLHKIGGAFTEKQLQEYARQAVREAVAAAMDVQKLAEVFREAMSWGRSYGTHLNLSPITIEDVSEQFADKAAKAMLAAAPEVKP